MANYSFVQLAGVAGNQSFPFTFPYLNKADITVKLDGVLTTAFTWTNANTIHLNVALAGDTVVEIRRVTPVVDQSVVFNNGSTLNETDLNNSDLQKLYLDQEVEDFTQNAIALNALGKFDATTHQIQNVVDPTLAQDVATKAYVDSTTPASAAAALASQIAAAASAATASADAATATTQAGTATTQATNAAASAASALSSKNSCDSDKTACDSDKTACDTDATNAAASASAAATSASAAATSASAAASSASSTASDKTACDSDKTACDADKTACDADVTAAAASAAAAAASAASVATAYTAYSGTANVASTDRSIKLSGASFTLTLLTAVGQSGRIITISHRGTSLTQLYTIATTSSQTIANSDGTTTSFILYTNGESVTVISDGANWRVVDHLTSTDWVTQSGVTIGGTTTGPTKASSPTEDRIEWRRQGNLCHIRMLYYKSSTATGAAVGSGDYLYSFPTNIAADNTYITVVTSISPIIGLIAQAFMKGQGWLGVDGGSQGTAYPVAYSTTQWRLFTGTGWASSANFAMNQAGLSMFTELTIRAANWRA